MTVCLVWGNLSRIPEMPPQRLAEAWTAHSPPTAVNQPCYEQGNGLHSVWCLLPVVILHYITILLLLLLLLSSPPSSSSSSSSSYCCTPYSNQTKIHKSISSGEKTRFGGSESKPTRKSHISFLDWSTMQGLIQTQWLVILRVAVYIVNPLWAWL